MQRVTSGGLRLDEGTPIFGFPPGYMQAARPGRLLVISNCQTFGLANALRALSKFRVDGLVGNEVKPAEMALLPEALAGYDHVLASPRAAKSLALTAGNVALIPEIFFDGYHPDEVALNIAGTADAHGPVGNSQIAFAAFCKGLSARDAVALFNRRTYEAAGYMGATWDSARALLAGHFQRAGFALERHFYAWCAQGPFMHTGSHPRIGCLVDLAREALGKIGQTPRAGPVPVEDNLLSGPVFPVYAEIAEAFGFAGSYVFKPGGTPYTIGLDAFVEESFARYARIGRDRLVAGGRPKPEVIRRPDQQAVMERVLGFIG
jgi:Polysaccharide biosynthesis enzyme WcbI